MNIKEQLREAYQKKWPLLKQAIESDGSFNKNLHPHLLSVTSDFEKEWWDAKLRIMVFGISTNGWDCKKEIYSCPDAEAVDAMMALYEGWYFDGGNWEYGEPFWNYFYALRELIKYKINPRTSLIWNNVYKLNDKQGEFEREHFNLTEDEISIFQPNVILVLGLDAGRILHSRLSKENYNYVIEDVFHARNDPEKERYLYTWIEGSEYQKLSNFLKKIIITYHPNAHGNAGIKLKLLMDGLKKELKTT